MANNAPTFGLWYDFRQRLPFTERYDDFYVDCLEEIEEGERLDFTNVWLLKHHFVYNRYFPSPLVASEVAPKVCEMVRA